MSLEGFVRGVEGLNKSVGVIVSWMTLGTVIVCFATVYTRYALNTNFTWLQDLYLWQHAAVIVLGAAYTVVIGGFVRVDIFYSRWPPPPPRHQRHGPDPDLHDPLHAGLRLGLLGHVRRLLAGR